MSPFFMDSHSKVFSSSTISKSIFRKSFTTFLYFRSISSKTQIEHTLFSNSLNSAVIVNSVYNCMINANEEYEGNTVIGKLFESSDYPNYTDRRPYLSSDCNRDFSFLNCRFENCYATSSGGGLSFKSETNKLSMKQILFTNCRVTNSNDDTYGGGIYFTGYEADISSCCFYNCTGQSRTMGTALFSSSRNDEKPPEKMTLSYVGSYNIPNEIETPKANGPPMIIYAYNVQSSYINTTGARSFRSGGITYMRATSGKITFHSISQCVGHNIIAFLKTAGKSAMEMSYFNIESNTVDDDQGGNTLTYLTTETDTKTKIVEYYLPRPCFIWNEANRDEGIKLSNWNFYRNKLDIQSEKTKLTSVRIYNDYSGGPITFVDSYVDDVNDTFKSGFYLSGGNSIAGLTFTNTVQVSSFPGFQYGECGIPSSSLTFKATDWFSESNYFSVSQRFTETNYFSQTNNFSQSIAFSQSSDFVPSSGFTKSKSFTGSGHFSKTESFSETHSFSISSAFSYSGEFTGIYHSNLFSASFMFTSKPFEGGDAPTNSGMPIGVIVGIVFGIIAVLAIIVIVIVFIIKKRNEKLENQTGIEMTGSDITSGQITEIFHYDVKLEEDPFKEDFHEFGADPFIKAFGSHEICAD